MRYFNLLIMLFFLFTTSSFAQDDFANIDVNELMVGKWIGGQYMQLRADPSSEPIIDPIILKIVNVGSDGKIYGSYEQYKPNFEALLDKGELKNYHIDLLTGEILVKGEDEMEEGHLYGDSIGSVIIGNEVSFRLDFVPFEKYRNHPFLQKYDVWNQYVKN